MKRSSKQVRRMLELRKTTSSKRPVFRRSESWRLKRVHPSWRRPKGIDHHMAHHIKGYCEVVRVGYRGPRMVRGLHPSGYREALASNPEDLNRLVPGRDAVKISSRVGLRKRLDIVKRASELGLHVINPGRAKVES